MRAESSNNVTEGEGSMTQRNRGRGWRLFSLGLATGLLFVLAGDPGRALTYPISGTDPLEVLDLKIKPNVVVLLDSSGSMRGRLAGGNVSGDHPRSKLYQAKSVLNDIVALNENKVSFMFGTYTQAGSRLSNRTAGDARFMYYTRSDLWPSMLTDEITIQRARNDTNDRGFQAWQWIDAQWNTLWFDTGGGVDCAASVPAGFYQTGASLATALQNAMNATSCGSDFTV
ncbi:MAG: VWA domain-containing protein, partial [Acidobacteria bacterium]|nr:VWA domain-containing protein [Acidobacteriota bacterium]